MKTLLLFCAICIIAVFSQAQIIHVPDDYPTIQQGINAATNGDTVLVSDGTYYEQINFLGKKPLVVASEFLTTGDNSHIANTIIDGSLITGDSCSVIYFIGGEDTTSVLFGFTVQGGHGTAPEYGRDGGGIYCRNGCSIVSNIIQNNQVIETVNGAAGGGIFVLSDSPVHIINNTIRQNLADCQSPGQNAAAGGAIFIWALNTDGNLHNIRGNLIEENEARTSSSYLAIGGGIMLQQVSVGVENNIFKNNVSRHSVSNGSNGGALHWYDYMNGSYIRNNSFIDNTAEQYGGALSVVALSSVELLIENNYFVGNSAIKGGALCMWESKVRMQNNVFNSNEATSQGGACYLNHASLSVEHMSVLINNSFYNNHSAMGGAIMSYWTKPLIVNSIFWNDTANTGQDIYMNYGDSVDIAYTDIDMSLVSGGNVIDGGGNINEDPLFMSPDYLMLSESSTCIDNGIDTYSCFHGVTCKCPEYDILNTDRTIDGYVDMGAYEWYLGVGIPSYDNCQLQTYIYPNPAMGIVNYKFSIVDGQFVSIRLYDQIGREVGTLLEQQLEPGEHTMQFDISKLPAGIYFWRFTVGNQQPVVGKMIRL